MTLVSIDNDVLLKILIDRLLFWTDDVVKIELFTKRYDRLLNDGVFNNGYFDASLIVDNDYLNSCIVTHKDELEKYSDGTIDCMTDDNEYYLIVY